MDNLHAFLISSFPPPTPKFLCVLYTIEKGENAIYQDLLLFLAYLVGMATSIDFNTRVLGHSSDQVLGYSDDCLPTLYQHCIFHEMSCTNGASREVTLERNRAADFSMPVQFIRQFSVFFYSSSVLRKILFHDKIIIAILEHSK